MLIILNMNWYWRIIDTPMTLYLKFMDTTTTVIRVQFMETQECVRYS